MWGSNGTEDDYLRVLGLCVQGQKTYKRYDRVWDILPVPRDIKENEKMPKEISIDQSP